MKIEKIFIGGDHAAYYLKNELKKELLKYCDEVIDIGTDSPTKSVDYPDFAQIVCKNISQNTNYCGVLICGTGIGISIAANRHPKIRCALCHDTETAKLSREHNDANILAFGARIIDLELAKEMCNTFFSTEFAGGRHENRIKKIEGCSCVQ